MSYNETKEIEGKKEGKLKEEKTEEKAQENINMQEKQEFRMIPNSIKININKKIVILLIVIFSLVVLLTLFSTIFAIININTSKIINGVSINNIDVSKLTIEQAKEKVLNGLNIKLEKEIILKLNDFEQKITPKQLNAYFDIDTVVQEAYNVGRNGNIFNNNFEVIFTLFNKNNKRADIIYDQELLNNIIEDIKTKIPNLVEQSDYSIEEDVLVISKGKEGNQVKEAELKQLIEKIINVDEEQNVLNIPVDIIQPDPIDIEKIHSEIYKEPKDAYFSEENSKVTPHINGVDFAISMEEVKALLNEDKDVYEIKLKITKPKITTNQLGSKAFPHLLGSFSTNYAASNVNRTQNLILSSNKINGTVVMPGEIFSYNKVVGKRTVEAGYKEAAMYQNGEVVDGLGGGICQISSTLYNAVIYANLDIVQRKNHQFVPSYIGASRDATVVYGAIDFKFKNSRSNPIKIVSSVGGGYATVKIYGVKENTEYDVDIQASIIQKIPYEIEYKDISSLPEGKEQVINKGQYGYKSQAYKILKLNGREVSRNLLSTDTYSTMKRIVNRGTKPVIQAPKLETPKVTLPEVQPEVSPVNEIENKVIVINTEKNNEE